MRLQFVLLAAFSTAAVAARAQEPSTIARTWDSIASGLPADPQDAARVLNQVFRDRGLPLLYWPKEGLPDSVFRDLDIGDGPCGAVAFVESQTIPPRDNRLVGETVAELDSTGRPVRRWPVPLALEAYVIV